MKEFVNTADMGGKLRSSLLHMLCLKCPSKVVGCMSLEFGGRDGPGVGHWVSAYRYLLKPETR